MKVLSIFVVVLMIISCMATIQSSSSTNTLESVSPSNLDFNSANTPLTDPETETNIISDWKASEDSYWQEQMKNYQLTKFFGNASEGIDLATPMLTSKVASSTDYYTDTIAINIDTEKVFYKPGDTVNFIIQTTRNMEPISTQLNIAIYNSLNNFYYQYGGYYYRDPTAIPFSSYSFFTNQVGFYHGSFTVQSEGQYAMFVSQTSIDQDYYYGASAYRVITVSDIGIYSRIPYYFIPSQPITGYAILMNGTDFTPISTADVTISYYLYDWNTNTATIQNTWAGTTDNAGKVVFSVPTKFSSLYWGYLTINANKDGIQSSLTRSVWSSYHYQQQSGIDFVPTFDKPIYQPGEALHARVLVWNNDYLNATKSPLINQPITIQLLNPQSSLLFQFQRITDEYGIVTFDLPLDETLEVGTYKIIFMKNDFQQIVEIPINYYEKPAFRVTINLDKQYVPDGHSVKGSISAQYYFGKPVTNAEVTISLFSTTNVLKKQVTGVTDGQGLFTFSLPVQASDDEPTLNLIASVVDPVGRQVESSASIITVSGIYLGAWISPWTPTPTDELQVSFYAYQGLNLKNTYYSYYSWEPIANENITITIKGVNTNVLGKSSTTLKELVGTTNNYGYGWTKFSLSLDTVKKYSTIEVEVKISLKDGRSESYTTTVQYAKYYTQISFDKDQYLAGDTVQLDVSVRDLNNKSSTAFISISVFDADYDIIYRGSNNITDTSTYNLKLSSYAPVGSYLVYTIITYKVQGEWGYVYDRYVYSGRNTFQVGTPEHLDLSTTKETYASGELITLRGSLVYQPQNPMYIEISKRGLYSLQSFSPLTNNFEIELNNTEYLAPKITLVLVTILPSGIILEAYKVIHIEEQITVSISSDKQTYEPGEEATITIKLLNSNNQPIDGLAVISLIDSSVYGVKEDPEWEVEHFSSDDYWSIMSTSTNWRGFQPIWFYYWYWYDYGLYSSGFFTRGGDLGVVYATVSSQEKSNIPTINTDQITVRDKLPESMNWQPETYIPKEGYTFTTILADTIGEWTVRVTATKGQVGALEKYTFTTQLPFFIEMDKPATAIQDDIITIKGIFYNYLGKDIQANVSITVDDSLVLNKETQSVRIPDNYLSSVRWSIYLPTFGSLNITIYAQTIIDGVTFSDGLRKQLVVTANAIDESVIQSGIITPGGVSFNITQYQESIQNLQYLVISRGMNDVVLNSWERLVGYPYGCLEQTMSKLLPDILILQYLQVKNQLTDSTKAQIEQMIASGIARVYSMQKSDGGFGWFGSDISNIYMTSYAIYGLNVLMKYNYTSNTQILKNAVNYLIQHQSSDGHWSYDNWYMDDIAFTAFTLRNLAQLNSSLSKQLENSIIKAIQYIKNSWSNNPDSYTAALYLMATYGTVRYDPTFGTILLDYLNNNQKSDSNQGIYWSTDDLFWKPLGGTTETTALVLQALSRVDFSQYYSLISSSIKWLLQEQHPWGWSNTKATSEALTTIIDYATQTPYSNTGEVTIAVNGDKKTKVVLSEGTDIQPIYFSDYIAVGPNIITLTSSANSSFVYYFNSKQLLKIEPKIGFNDKLSVNANSNFKIPFNLTLLSSNVALKDLKISLVGNTFQNNSVLSYNVPYTNETLTGSFSLISGTDIQTISIKGIEIEYLLTNLDQTSQSPGKIKQVFGPIIIDVTNNPTVNNLRLQSSSTTKSNLLTSQSLKRSSIETKMDMDFTKSYSQFGNIAIGDFITVAIKINAFKDISDQYFFVKDTIPSGFTIDEESLKQNSALTSYSLTGDSLTFFISSISKSNGISISYKIQATTTILASIAPAASLSSMYNDQSKVFSESVVLGDNLLKLNDKGVVQRDLVLPSMTQVKYNLENNNKINFEITAKDTEGIEQVTLFYKLQNWNSQDLKSKAEGAFTGSIQTSSVSYVKFYVQIQDKNGNNFESEILSIKLPVIKIETGLLLAVLFVTGVIGITGYKYSKKKLFKKKFE